MSGVALAPRLGGERTFRLDSRRAERAPASTALPLRPYQRPRPCRRRGDETEVHAGRPTSGVSCAGKMMFWLMVRKLNYADSLVRSVGVLYAGVSFTVYCVQCMLRDSRNDSNRGYPPSSPPRRLPFLDYRGYISGHHSSLLPSLSDYPPRQEGARAQPGQDTRRRAPPLHRRPIAVRSVNDGACGMEAANATTGHAGRTGRRPQPTRRGGHPHSRAATNGLSWLEHRGCYWWAPWWWGGRQRRLWAVSRGPV